MNDDTSKLLKACVEYRAMVDKLEREKTALRNEIARLSNQTNWVCSCGGTDCAGQKENAALREDKERLDWLDQKIVSSWLDGKDFLIWDKSSPLPCSIREWLDAARKEAQP